ncbi:MAG: hypothetical protein JW841_11665, partial [Deltaproteobacteria bacterium]|nr:hypothetical protein [Deltaproteobacteria bacterium]
NLIFKSIKKISHYVRDDTHVSPVFIENLHNTQSIEIKARSLQLFIEFKDKQLIKREDAGDNNTFEYGSMNEFNLWAYQEAAKSMPDYMCNNKAYRTAELIAHYQQNKQNDQAMGLYNDLMHWILSPALLISKTKIHAIAYCLMILTRCDIDRMPLIDALEDDIKKNFQFYSHDDWILLGKIIRSHCDINKDERENKVIQFYNSLPGVSENLQTINKKDFESWGYPQ